MNVVYHDSQAKRPCNVISIYRLAREQFSVVDGGWWTVLHGGDGGGSMKGARRGLNVEGARWRGLAGEAQ